MTGIASDLVIRKVDVPTGNAAQLVTDAALADLEGQPGRIWGIAMAKITKLGMLTLASLTAFSKTWRKVGFGIGFPK